jgi:BirA family transcriptional regulator, biotin operon repressor / biotin---[acetyl-CoA-carboxylase] ligase
MIIGSKLLFVKNLPSTNAYAASLLKNIKLPEGTVIYTNHQSSGRGQGGNKWESDVDMNLLISILLFPSMIAPAEQFLISMAISLGICDFLDRYTPAVSIKWPNDIYANNDKIAGVLIENSIMGNRIENTIAGIGININQKIFLSDAPNPVSLSILTGREYNLSECLSRLVSDLDKRYKCLISGDYSLLKGNYLSRLYRNGEWFRYRDTYGIFTGRIVNVCDTGRLQVEKEDGIIDEYSFKEIEFIL